jgi:hypothetical protein
MVLSPKLGGTKLENATKWIRDKVLQGTKSGDGSTVDRPKLYVMLITDGVETYHQFTPPDWKMLPFTPYAPTAPDYLKEDDHYRESGHLQAINPALCAEMKSVRNVTLLPLQVTYLVPKGGLMGGDARFPWIQTYLLDSGHVDRSFEKCASDPNYAFKGTTPPEITKAVLAMFNLTTAQPARLLK